jgi:hypothetical protein
MFVGQFKKREDLHWQMMMFVGQFKKREDLHWQEAASSSNLHARVPFTGEFSSSPLPWERVGDP